MEQQAIRDARQAHQLAGFAALAFVGKLPNIGAVERLIRGGRQKEPSGPATPEQVFATIDKLIEIDKRKAEAREDVLRRLEARKLKGRRG
jgi:hypothetical protein